MEKVRKISKWSWKIAMVFLELIGLAVICNVEKFKFFPEWNEDPSLQIEGLESGQEE